MLRFENVTKSRFLKNLCLVAVMQKKIVEYAIEKEGMKQSNIETKKEERHRCSDDQNDRAYKQKKKGKLKAKRQHLT